MITEELMIGDWVQDKYQHIPFQIRNMSEKVVNYYPHSDSGYMEDEIEPIPITPEILKNNGFEKGSNWYFENVIIYFLRSDYVNIIISEDYTDIDMYIKYVHELQNLFNICKINKEIVL